MEKVSEIINTLLEQNIITKEEYVMLKNRVIHKSGFSYQTYYDIISGYNDYCAKKYSTVTSKSYENAIVNFIISINEVKSIDVLLHKSYEVFTYVAVNKFKNAMYLDGAGKQKINKYKYALMVFCDYLKSTVLKLQIFLQ